MHIKSWLSLHCGTFGGSEYFTCPPLILGSPFDSKWIGLKMARRYLARSLAWLKSSELESLKGPVGAKLELSLNKDWTKLESSLKQNLAQNCNIWTSCVLLFVLAVERTFYVGLARLELSLIKARAKHELSLNKAWIVKPSLKKAEPAYFSSKLALN